MSTSQDDFGGKNRSKVGHNKKILKKSVFGKKIYIDLSSSYEILFYLHFIDFI